MTAGDDVDRALNLLVQAARVSPPLRDAVGQVEAALAVRRAKLAMYEDWLRENVPDCPLLSENIVADLAADHYS